MKTGAVEMKSALLIKTAMGLMLLMALVVHLTAGSAGRISMAIVSQSDGVAV